MDDDGREPLAASGTAVDDRLEPTADATDATDADAADADQAAHRDDGRSTDGAATDDRPVVAPTDPSRRADALRVVGVVLIFLALVAFARSFHEDGHGWGDDFALYVNQARGLVDGTASQVVADNRFAIDNSAYSSFSPPAYPWLFPALLAPIVMLKGLDWNALKLVGTISYAVGVLLLHRLLVPRLSQVEALVVTVFVAVNVWFVTRTDQVLSDLPYWAAYLLALFVLDRLVRREALLGDWRATMWAGLAVLAPFNIRREAFILLAAVAAAQLVAVVSRRTAPDGPIAAVRSSWRALAAPYLAFVGATSVIQLARPAPILGATEGAGETGWVNVDFNVDWYRDILAEYLGLKDVGPDTVDLFGSEALGSVALAAALVLAVVGIVAALVHDVRRDVHLVVAFVLGTVAVLTQPYRDGRYVLSLVPLFLYFVLRGLRTVVAVAIGRWPARPGRPTPRVRAVAAFVPVVLFVPLGISAFTDTWQAFDYHRRYDYTTFGPASPEVVEMFDAVERFTDARDVVVFNQARTMNLMTRRRAIQGNSIPMMLERGDWYAMARGTDYIQTPLTDAEAADLGFVKVWENGAYVLWRIPEPTITPLG